MSALLALALAACSGEAPAPPSAETASAETALAASSPEASPVRAPVPAADVPESDPAGPETWTTAPLVGKGAGSHARVKDIRAATHEGFDRIVLEFERESAPEYRLVYLAAPPANCASGAPAEVEGGGVLQVQLMGTSGHDDAGAATTPKEVRPALSVVREIERVCDFEGVVAFAVGVKAPTPFRAFTLAAPARLVVDVRR
jgi:hypothetical protein